LLGLRARFVSDLAKDLLGPREGSLETFPLSVDPRQEYQVGQLFPQTRTEEITPDNENTTLDGMSGEDEDEEASPAPLMVQGQNFRRNPSSFGFSFSVNKKPVKDAFKICATWARYTDNGAHEWVRQPRYLVVSYDPDSHYFLDAHQEVRVDTKVSQVGSSFRVSVYLSSTVAQANQSYTKTEELIFQPELRVVYGNEEEIIEMAEGGFASSDKEWRISMRQYDDRKVLSRGHLCGVYWREIDPQQNHSSTEELPFVWTDGRFFIDSQKEELTYFLNPSFRTDFLPMYSAPSPQFELEDASIKLDAKSFTAVENSAQLQKLISPFLDSYSDWVQRQKSQNKRENEIDKDIISRHEAALVRMRDGLDFLLTDKDALAAFSFMNAAMDLQTNWARRGAGLKWRPFQLGFILLTIRSSVDKNAEFRDITDVIWFPTGGGKSEAYLGLAAFVSTYRRLKGVRDQDGHLFGAGISILSRYTLRLLTIQQFRRALRVVMAMEYLRIKLTPKGIGWRPNPSSAGDFIWGSSPFSIGLWAGQGVTPNKMSGESYRGSAAGAISILKRIPSKGESDPAQVLNCPCCNSILAIPVSGLQKGKSTIHLFSYEKIPTENISDLVSLSDQKVKVSDVKQIRHVAGSVYIITFNLELETALEPNDIDKWWKEKIESVFNIRLASFNSIRPGYIPVQDQGRRNAVPHDYEIRCPNPTCNLHNVKFSEKIPVQNGYDWRSQHYLFTMDSDPTCSYGLPIQAITVDEKLYSRPPTFLIGTCDKLAVIASYGESAAAALFGRVRSFAAKDGYSQEFSENRRGSVAVPDFPPPDLVIQDELHLLDGPLGSSFGLYEAALNELCSYPKYIASSATIRNAGEQVKCMMSRDAVVFPPVNKDIGDGFFLKINEAHALDESSSGRLFVGIATPGKAAQTPIVRIWARLLQTAQDLLSEGAPTAEVDYFWTLAGYFNAIRELAGGQALWRQDIPDRIKELVRQSRTNKNPRDVLSMEIFKNLSSQTDSSELPGILTSLERTLMDGDALSGVAATSMFGTGVDVDRLSLMVVHGQPKSASSYIQAVGRVGRKKAGLAIVFLRTGKPRDLNHYEYFTGYHRRLSVSVEPISVKPFAPRAIERILGPLIVLLLRNLRTTQMNLPRDIWRQDGAGEILSIEPKVIQYLKQVFSSKFNWQPEHRRPKDETTIINAIDNAIDRWTDLARRSRNDQLPLKYFDNDKRKAVLGPIGINNGDFAFLNAPTSLREVEPTIRIYTRER